MEEQPSSENDFSKLKIEPNPYITEELVEQIETLYFTKKMSIDKIMITNDFKNELLGSLRESEKAKYLLKVITLPKAETVIPEQYGEGFKIIMDIDAYPDEFSVYLGLIHEFCHVRDIRLFFQKYGYVHTRPLSFLQRLHYPEFLIWSEYIAIKNSFEYTVEFFSTLHPYDSLNIEVGLEVPEMHKLYHEMIAEEKKDPRFADAIKLETAVMLERFMKIYFAANLAKIELNNSSFSDKVKTKKLELDDVMELRHFIFENELSELGGLLIESVSFRIMLENLKMMSISHNNIIDKLKLII